MPPEAEGPRKDRDPRPEWARLHLWQIQGVRDVAAWLALFGLILLGERLSIVTVPLLLAILAAYLFEPVVRRLAGHSWFSREGAAAALIALSASIAIVPIILAALGVIQGVRLAVTTSEKIAKVQTAYNFPEVHFDESLPHPWPVARVISYQLNAVLREPLLDDIGSGAWRSVAEQLIEWRDGPVWGPDTPGAFDDFDDLASWIPGVGAEDVRTAIERGLTMLENQADTIAKTALETGIYTGANAITALVRTVQSIGFLAFSAFLTAFFFFFISTGWASFLAFGRSLLPKRNREQVTALVGRMDRAIAGFIRGRLTIALLQGIFFTIGYWLIGVPAPLILGPAVAILSIVPYAALVGIPISVVLLWFSDSTSGFQAEWWWVLGAPIAVYFIGQALDDYVFTPLIQGKSTDMDTPTILFASIAGGSLMGIYGLLVAIPLAACVKILLQEVFWPRFRAWSEGKEADFLPIDDE